MTKPMKPSGIEWASSIPFSWNVTRLHLVLKQVKNRNYDNKENNLLSLSYGKIVKKDINNATGLVPENFDTYNVVRKNDIVLRLTDLQNDQVSLRTALVEENQGIITSAYVTLRPNEVNSSFYHWYLYAFDVTKEIYALGQGVRQNLTYEELKKTLVLLPPFDEQQSIADFLNKHCSKIDDIATDIEKQIEVLQKYKKSLIIETVTKGLDKSVPMKDSNIKWIGKTPSHWEIFRIKDLSDMQTGTTPPGNEGINYDFCGVPWFTPSDFQDNSITLLKPEKTIDDETVKRERIRLYPEKSVLFVGIASIGKIGYFDRISYSNQQITAIKLKEKESSCYAAYALLAAMDYIKGNALYTTVPIINNSYLGLVKICLPPENERQKIVSFLNDNCQKIDEIIAGKNSQLKTIQQYKRSLIYEYVTGKKRVAEVKY